MIRRGKITTLRKTVRLQIITDYDFTMDGPLPCNFSQNLGL